MQHAAAVHPQHGTDCIAPPSNSRGTGAGLQGGCPVLVNMHGTGISASDSADGFKMMKEGDSEYTFGLAGGWVLAPSRHGAHNWEGKFGARNAP